MKIDDPLWPIAQAKKVAPDRRGRRGNCYVTCEALYHLLGGAASGWVPHTVRHEGDVHWYLVRTQRFYTAWSIHPSAGSMAPPFEVLDPTAAQFRTPPPYERGVGRGFLTRGPSRRARELMEAMLWQAAPRPPRRRGTTRTRSRVTKGRR